MISRSRLLDLVAFALLMSLVAVALEKAFHLNGAGIVGVLVLGGIIISFWPSKKVPKETDS